MCGYCVSHQVAEIIALLALMFKHASEHSHVIVYGDCGYRQVELESGTILDNMANVLAMQTVRLLLERPSFS